MSDLVLALPSHRAPLVLRSTGHESTIRAAEGFGVKATPAQLDRIQADLFAAFASGRSAVTEGSRTAQDPVTLRQPDMARVRLAAGDEGKRLTADALLTLLLGKLQTTLGDFSLQSLRHRLDVHRAQLGARAAQAGQLSENLQAALDAALAAQDSADSVAAEAGAHEGALEAARADVERLRSELDAMDPADPAHAGKRAELDAALVGLQQAQARYDAAGQRLVEAAEALESRLSELESLRARADDFNAGQPLGIDLSSAKQRDAKTLLMLITVLLSQLVSKGADEHMKVSSELALKTIKARHLQESERLRKHEEELQRARDAEKKTGCAGKIFGWIGAAVGVIASVGAIVVGALHGNVALVAAGVMGMMLTIDSIVGMTTGFSVVGKAIEGLGGLISSALVAFGVDEGIAKQVGSIMATVVVIAAIVAVMMVTGNIAAAGRTAAGAAGSVKAAGESAMRAAQAIEQGTRVLQFVAQAMSAIGQITHNVGQVIVAGIMVDVAKLLAMIQNSLFGNEVLQQMLQRMGEAVALQHRTALDLLVQMSQVSDDRAETGRHIISLTRHRA